MSNRDLTVPQIRATWFIKLSNQIYHGKRDLDIFWMWLGFMVGLMMIFSSLVVLGQSTLLGTSLLVPGVIFEMASLYAINLSIGNSNSLAKKLVDKLGDKKVMQFDKQHGWRPREGSKNNPFGMRFCSYPELNEYKNKTRVYISNWNFSKGHGWQKNKGQFEQDVVWFENKDMEQATDHFAHLGRVCEERNQREKGILNGDSKPKQLFEGPSVYSMVAARQKDEYRV